MTLASIATTELSLNIIITGKMSKVEVYATFEIIKEISSIVEGLNERVIEIKY